MSDGIFQTDDSNTSNKSGNQESQPSRLYHYTNLESLAQILSNRTIRLMPLTGMDDLQEPRTSDVPNLGQFTFVSCWTDNAKEDIPMWNMYTSLDRGVRLCLPTMPFKRYKYTAEEYARVVGCPTDHVSTPTGYMESFLPASDLAKGLMSIAYLEGFDVLTQVQYTSDKKLLEPNVLSVDAEGTKVASGIMGKYKNEYWAFQREWRYRLQIVPFNVLDMTNAIERFNNLIIKMINGTLPAPCAYYDLHLSDEALQQLEVVASPKMTAGNKLLLEALLKQHGFEWALKESELTGLI